MARFLYILIVMYLAKTAWNLAVQWLGAQARRQMGTTGPNQTQAGSAPPLVDRGHMVRDPICGLHIPESRALVEQRSGERFHFCSERCRESFVRAH